MGKTLEEFPFLCVKPLELPAGVPVWALPWSCDQMSEALGALSKAVRSFQNHFNLCHMTLITTAPTLVTLWYFCGCGNEFRDVWMRRPQFMTQSFQRGSPAAACDREWRRVECGGQGWGKQEVRPHAVTRVCVRLKGLRRLITGPETHSVTVRRCAAAVPHHTSTLKRNSVFHFPGKESNEFTYYYY